MVSPLKTPSQSLNSTISISPHVNSKRQNVFATPPNPEPLRTLDSPRNRTILQLFRIANETCVGSMNQTESLLPADELRAWRYDAWIHHNLKSSEFVADKVLALTGDPHDAYWLAQVYIAGLDYLRAHLLLCSKPEYIASGSCRYLAALCLTRLDRWDDALDLIGEFETHTGTQEYVLDSITGTCVESSMCVLRGRIYANQNDFERAKMCYKQALKFDVKCYEAFSELIENNLMTADEEWEFTTSLDYRDAGLNLELVKSLYTLRLSKYLNVSKFKEVSEVLGQEYELSDNLDILSERADYWYVHCNFDECLALCDRVLANDPQNMNIIPHYLACLHELGSKNMLFSKAHELAQHYPKKAMTWLSIGIYYLAINKINEARKYFSKATLLDPNFGHAWIGFAHTFAAEGEHEQAISAYAFAARLYPGTHLPNLFLGMQHLKMGNLNLAEEYLAAAHNICGHDPLLLNEMGVIYFHKDHLGHAEHMLQEALRASKYLNSDSRTWIAIHSNLGHVYRRSGNAQRALECFSVVRKISNRNDHNILLAMGLVHIQLGNRVQAIDVIHDALAMLPTDPVALDLLKRALESNSNSTPSFLEGAGKRAFDLHMLTLEQRPRRQQDPRAAPFSHRNLRSSTRAASRQTNRCDTIPPNAEIEAANLIQGEESSDDDDEEMDVESD